MLKRFKGLNKRSRAIAIVLLIALVGTALLLTVAAAGHNTSLEPEDGSLAGGACVIPAGLGSGGQAVQFGGGCTVVNVPSNITSGATCAATLPDETKDMQDWMDTWPDNAVVRLAANRCYHIEYPLLIHDTKNTVFDGNGATIASYTDGCNGTQTAPHTFINCQYPSPVDALGRTQDDWPENRNHLTIRANTDLTIKNLSIRGGKNRPGYDADYAFQHGFYIFPNDGVTIDNVKADQIWGDFIFMIGVKQDDGSRNSPSNITVKNSTFGLNSGGEGMGAGRQGVAIDDGLNIHIQNNKFYYGNRSAIDIEPVTSAAELYEIYFDNNEWGDFHLGWFANHPYADANPIISGLYFRHNRIIGDGLGVDSIVGGVGDPRLDNLNTADASSYRRHNYQFIDNTSNTALGSGNCSDPAAQFKIWGVDGILLQDNIQPTDFNRCSAIINSNKNRNVRIIGNQMLNDTDVALNGYSSSRLVCERDNQIGNPLTLAPLTPGATRCP